MENVQTKEKSCVLCHVCLSKFRGDIFLKSWTQVKVRASSI